MCASPLDFLRSGPPPPRAVVLPDGLFFSRAVAVDPQAEPEAVSGQVALALEASSPFPLEQLNYGFYWVPGSDRALAFAAYRRRFTPEQTQAWSHSEIVLPAFAAVLGAEAEPATTAVLASPAGLTAVHWERGSVPAQVVHQPLPADATDEERGKVRDALLKRFESRKIVELSAAPVADSDPTDRNMVFKSGDFVSSMPAEAAANLDVRAKDELAAYRRSRGRDLLLWRVAMGCLWACGLMILGEGALFAGGFWMKTRRAQIDIQAPIVAQIQTAKNLATHIEDLSTKRLLPMEMLSIAAGPKPPTIQLMSVNAGTTTGLYTLKLEGQTNNGAEIPAYQNALKDLPFVAGAEVNLHPTRNNLIPFTLTVSFKPGTIKAAAAPAP